MTTLPPQPARTRASLAPLLNTIGALVVAFWAIVQFVGGLEPGPFIVVLSLLALAVWIARAYAPETGATWIRLRDAACVFMIVAGSLATQPTGALLITPAIVGLVTITSDLRHRIGVGVVLAVVGAAIVMAESLGGGETPGFLLGCLGGFALGLVVGVSRRQTVRAEIRERELFARTLEVENEQQRSALLADRATIARDIHDVLAHSLGGLVIQLDAVEALLEAGRVDDAAFRVTAARALAADGLGEARRAVAALRDPSPAARPDPATDALAAQDALGRLLETHISLGGTLDTAGSFDLTRFDVSRLDIAHRRALVGAVREALSNARRHAAGAPVTLVASEADPGILRVTLSNPVTASGGDGPTLGNGLVGMRERYRELGYASSVDVGVVDGAFVVDTRTVLS